MATVDGLNNVPGNYEVKTPYGNKEDNQVSVDSFLQLMIAQLKNQDFMNPTDDTQYVTQLAQFATMQQMQELAYYSKTNYVMSLVGKDVTVASLSLGGSVNKVSGPVEKVVLSNNDFLIYVKGKGYTMNQIMTVDSPGSIANGDADNATKISVMLMNRTSTSASLRWDPPSQDPEVNEKYTYKVYYSENKEFDTVAQVKNGTLVGNTDASSTIMDINSLEPGKTYFANVVVTAPDGTERVYQKLTFTTKEA